MKTRERGQMVAMFAGMLIPIVILVGLAIDGSYAYAQRRQTQNAADLASFAGARQIALYVGGNATIRDCDVRKAIDRVLATNRGQAIPQATYGTASGPRYIGYNAASGTNTNVGAVPYDAPCTSTTLSGSGVPANAAIGVKVPAQIGWKPFFLGVVGVTNWTAAADATARMGYTDTPPAGSVFPIGIDSLSFDQTKVGHFVLCPPGSNPVSQGGTCPDQQIDDSNHSGGQLGPGNFGWLKFGAQNNCTGYGLGMLTNAGCPNGNPSLQDEIDGNTYGCCSKPTGGVSTNANPIDRIGGGQGHNGQGGDDCTAVILSKRTYLLPVYDQTGGNGNDHWYHIIGFAGWQVTACDGGKNATGVWRTPIVGGPTSQTVPPGPLKIIAVELVR